MAALFWFHPKNAVKQSLWLAKLWMALNSTLLTGKVSP
jgi:hypothetical protein